VSTKTATLWEQVELYEIMTGHFIYTFYVDPKLVGRDAFRLVNN